MNVLYVVKNMRISNGVASFAMNYYRELHSSINIDFLIISDVGSEYYEEIEKNGNCIYKLPSYKKNPFGMISYLKKIFKNKHYDIVHCNVFNSGFIVQYYAKKNKVPVRILHCHTTENGDTFIKKIRNRLFTSLTIHYCNYYFACSNLAGKSILKKRKFYVINNAIDVDKFSFNEKYRTDLRNTEKIANELIIIAVGRISKEKNPYFIVDTIKELKERNFPCKLWWFGSGKLDLDVKKYVKNNNLEKEIKFFGSRADVNKYYSAADVFILPSLYEGLPVVGLEAQCSGIYSLFANTITEEVKISKFTNFLPIISCDKWADFIINNKFNNDRKAILNSKELKKYIIKDQAQYMLDLYQKLCDDERK